MGSCMSSYFTWAHWLGMGKCKPRSAMDGLDLLWPYAWQRQHVVLALLRLLLLV